MNAGAEILSVEEAEPGALAIFSFVSIVALQFTPRIVLALKGCITSVALCVTSLKAVRQALAA